MFETLQNGAAIDATINALAGAGVTPAVAIFALLAGAAVLLTAAQTALKATTFSARRCDYANGPKPSSRRGAEPIRAARNPLPALMQEAAVAGDRWSKAA